MKFYNQKLESNYTSNFKWSYLFYFINSVLILLIIYNCIACINTIVNQSPLKIAYTPEMVIDGRNYLESAMEMIYSGNWFYTTNTYHSAGMQTLTAFVFRFFFVNPLVIKLINYVFWTYSLFLIGITSYRIFQSRLIALTAVMILSNDNTIQKYCATMQYEIIVMFFILLIFYLTIKRKYLYVGMLVAIITYFRIHYAVVILPICLYFYMKEISLNQIVKVLGVFTFLILLFILIYSLNTHTFTLFQSFPPLHHENWLCLGAKGSNYPYFRPDVNKVCGFNYVYHNFGNYLWLLGDRFLYLIGAKSDMWWIPPTFIKTFVSQSNPFYWSIVRWGALFSFFIFIAGTIKAIIKKDNEIILAISMPILCLLPLLIVGASSRFLVPFAPLTIIICLSIVGKKFQHT